MAASLTSSDQGALEGLNDLDAGAEIDSTRSESEESLDIVAIEFGQGFHRSLPFASRVVAGRFINPFSEWEERTTWEFIKWIFTRKCRNGIPTDPVVCDCLSHAPLC